LEYIFQVIPSENFGEIKFPKEIISMFSIGEWGKNKVFQILLREKEI